MLKRFAQATKQYVERGENAQRSALQHAAHALRGFFHYSQEPHPTFRENPFYFQKQRGLSTLEYLHRPGIRWAVRSKAKAF